MPDTPLLQLSNVDAFYGRIQALKGISLTINQGEIVTIIGANGAGKSTTLMTISGVVKAASGSILYEGQELRGLPAHTLPKRGLIQVPEGRRIFPRLTVLENLDMGAYLRKDADGIEEDKKMVFDLFPKLQERATQPGGTLSGGEQQMLAIARAFMGRPKLLLLDEPSLGLSPLFAKHIFKIIRTVNAERGMTILLVEQNANIALQMATRGYVLETGHVKLEDDAKTLLHNADIRKAYLGE